MQTERESECVCVQIYIHTKYTYVPNIHTYHFLLDSQIYMYVPKKINPFLKKQICSQTYMCVPKKIIPILKSEKKYFQIYMYVPLQHITYLDAVVQLVSPLDPFVDACLYRERERERETGCVC